MRALNHEKISVFISRMMRLLVSILLFCVAFIYVEAQWVTRDHRWPTRGPWQWAVSRELPQLYREFNGIDFGHAHLAETLIRTQNPEEVEQARLEVLQFIYSSPEVPPDEAQVAPTVTKLVWETHKVFDWSHQLHRSLWDLFASDETKDKNEAYRKILEDYLSKPEAVTHHRLDHHGKLWSFPESKAFRNKFPKFNSQIWAYHWLQAAAYDVQLMGDAAKQRELMPKIIEHYHGYLQRPPLEWQFMPMFHEGAPEFAARFPEAANIFDNMHMLHDNLDDVLSSPNLYPTLQAKREAILRILPIYLHRNHVEQDQFTEYHEAVAHGATQTSHSMKGMGSRPPSAQQVVTSNIHMEHKPSHESKTTRPPGKKKPIKNTAPSKKAEPSPPSPKEAKPTQQHHH